MSIQTLPLATLIVAAARVGITLEPQDDAANLYAWVTGLGSSAQPNQESEGAGTAGNDMATASALVVYVGKSASARRIKNEDDWRTLDPRHEILSGIVTLLRANSARCQPLHYDPESFESNKVHDLISQGQWHGDAIDALRGGLITAPSTEVVEEFMVRLAVRYGAPLGNAQYHSQWENPIGRPADTLAALAVGADTDFSLPDLPAGGLVPAPLEP